MQHPVLVTLLSLPVASVVGKMAERILMNEYKVLSKEAWVNIEVGHPFWPMTMLTGMQLNDENVMSWIVGLIVLNPDSLYYGGYFKVGGDM